MNVPSETPNPPYLSLASFKDILVEVIVKGNRLISPFLCLGRASDRLSVTSTFPMIKTLSIYLAAFSGKLQCFASGYVSS
jgi:hypothetical protein